MDINKRDGSLESQYLDWAQAASPVWMCDGCNCRPGINVSTLHDGTKLQIKFQVFCLHSIRNPQCIGKSTWAKETVAEAVNEWKEMNSNGSSDQAHIQAVKAAFEREIHGE